jgi:hypothetical protein
MANVFDGKQIAQSFVSGAGCTAATAQYRFVKLSADNTVVPCAATTDVPVGVLQEPCVVVGDPVNVCMAGVTSLQADASTTAGTPIATSVDGQAQTAVQGQYIVGLPLNVAGATTAGTLITASVNCLAPVPKP